MIDLPALLHISKVKSYAPATERRSRLRIFFIQVATESAFTEENPYSPSPKQLETAMKTVLRQILFISLQLLVPANLTSVSVSPCQAQNLERPATTVKPQRAEVSATLRSVLFEDYVVAQNVIAVREKFC